MQPYSLWNHLSIVHLPAQGCKQGGYICNSLVSLFLIELQRLVLQTRKYYAALLYLTITNYIFKLATAGSSQQNFTGEIYS